MKGYSIYRDNTVIYEFVVDDTISKSLSGNKYVSFTISSKNDLDLKIGDYVLVGNEKYEIFEPIDIEESNGVFTYPLTFYFQGYKLNNSIITDEGATTFAYHGEVSDFMTLLIDSLNEDYPEFTLGTIQNGSILDLSFDNSNCMAALQTVCENAKMEWDITGTIITVKSRIGEETDHVFEYGRNKGSYSVKLAKVANASITTRMIGKGGTLNLPADYVSPDSPKRLNLGNEVLEKNVNKYGKITGVYINENIYPRLINKTVLGVTIPDNIEEAGSWKIKLDIPFNLSDYYADNEVPVVKFQTGDLTGLDFEIVKNSWNNTDKTLSIIVKEEEDGYYLPNANRQPRVGDVFVLLNINMPQSYIDEATQELREATQNELNKKCEPQYAPSLSVQKHYIKKKGILLNIGDGITVKIGGRNITTRIIGTTETSDDIRVELGDQMLYTYDTKVNNTIEQIQFTLKQLINIDDIKRLFYNLINAWYPKWFNQKLHKDADVEFNSVKAAELVQSDNFSSKNFTSGALGSGHRIKDGNAEFQNLTVRGQFSVFEFLIQQVKAIGGKFCVSPAAIKTVSVEETENGYKCFFNTDSGTIMNPFVVGDQAFHQVFDGQKMKRYWRLVTEVGADYFVLSKTDCEANSGIPEADEEIVLLGNRTDINRQSAIMISAYDNNSPYIAFYAGINSYSFEGKEPMRTGNLNGIVDEDFGQLTGFGLYCQNVYMKGVFRLMSGKTVEESIGDVQSNLDNLQVGGTNLLNGTTLDWVDATNASPLYYVDSVYLPQLRGKQITYSGLIKGINAQANTIGLETDITYTDESHVYENIFFGNRGNFEIQVQEHILILDKEIRNIRTYPIFRNGTVSGTIKVKQIQVEIGNKATTWKPSINDQKEIAKQQGIAGGQEAVDKVQIGSQNLISKKMMLKWNEKNKDIAVWGQDEDGIYLDVTPKLLFNNITTISVLHPVFDITFKPKSQYVFSIEWKHKSPNPDNTGLAFYIEYDDGTRSNVFLTKDIKTKTITNVISSAGKTISKIYSGYGNGDINALIYNISLIEGNKPLQGFPVAEEDQTGANNVNLADGTKEFTIGAGSTNYAYKRLYVSKIKPNTVYYVNAGNIQNLAGTPSKYTFVLYNKDISTMLCPGLHADKNGGFLITYNNFTEQEGYLLCYAGISGSTLGNSVKFTEVMLVEGFLPAPVWTPSHGDVEQSIQDAIAKTVDITAPSQVFKYGAGYTGTPSPASIVLTALPRNFTPTSYQWQYLNGSTWTNISVATSSTYSVIPGNTTLFPSGTNVRTFRVVCDGDEKLSDSFTLAKLADGAQGAKGDKGDTGAQGAKGDKGDTGAMGTSGADAYTVLLTNESHAFTGSVSAALAGSTSCAVTAYKGATQVAATIGSISGLPAGMTASIANNGTTKATITFTVTTSMTTASGTVNIPVTVDGKSFTRVFSYSIAFKGATGAQGAKGDKGDTGAQGIPGESINGKMLYKDPEFKLGMNGVEKYSNSPNVDPDYIRDKLTVERIAKPSDAPTQSGYCLKITCKAAQSPGYGGVYQRINSRANAVFVQKIIAKIPVGYAINTASNSMGTGYTDTWLTSTNGTGKYTTYLRKTVCGATGTFYAGGHVYITGNPTPSESEPLEWYIASMTCFDQTADGYSDIEITTKDSFAAQLGFTNFEALEKNAVNSENGTLIQGGYINTNLIKADALIAIDGFIDKLKTNILAADSIKANMLSVAGFNFADYKIYGGAAYGSGPGIQITSETAERSFKAYKDTNNYIGMYYNSATDWGIKGVVGGATYLQLGNINKIGGFEIGSTYIQNGGLKLSSGSIEYKKDKLQSNFGALYTGITGIATGLYIKNTAISTMNRHELCAYFQGSIGDLQINSSKAMIETYNVSSMHYALYIPSGQVYMNANSGGIFFKNVQNVNGKSNYYLCIDRSTGQLYYR
nr:MAG TPA: tail protein [Caudoviricetes sp.]